MKTFNEFNNMRKEVITEAEGSFYSFKLAKELAKVRKPYIKKLESIISELKPLDKERTTRQLVDKVRKYRDDIEYQQKLLESFIEKNF